MALVRWALGKFILFLDWLFSPRPMQRTAEAQRKVEAAVAGLSIYEFRACPFCVRVRRFLRWANVDVPLKDAKAEPFRRELLEGGGKLQVPCLRVEKDGNVSWLYESKDIIDFLKGRLGV
jgi:glutaredoxin